MSETHDLLGEDFTAPTAPPQQSDSNDFFVIEEKTNASIDALVNQVADAVSSGKDDISKILGELSDSQSKLFESNKVVSAEADSSTSTKPVSIAKSTESSSTVKETTSDGSSCPYYNLACQHLSKIKIPKEVEDYLLWKDPKVTGAIFGTAFFLLISLASCSLLSVISTTAMLALTVAGAYRFYLAVLFRIKGTQDETFEKLSNMDVKIPKERAQEMCRFFETDFNRVINQVKSVVLWDNVTVSSLSFLGFYFVYCIGSVFNTITLMILVLVSVFTLPKVYQVYKAPIDAALDKTSVVLHKVVKQVQEKLPFLKKKKQ